MTADRMLDDLLRAACIREMVRTGPTTARVIYDWDSTLYSASVDLVANASAVNLGATTLGSWLANTSGSGTDLALAGVEPRGAERLVDELLHAVGVVERARLVPREPQWEFAAVRVLHDGSLYDIDVRTAPDERIPREQVR